MSKTKKIISIVLAALLVMAMATVAVSAMSADEIHVVAGAAELCGSAWDPADTNNQMTYNAEKDIYEKVFTNVAAGTYEFKVTTNYAWDQGDFNLEGDAMYGGANASVTVDADGSTVTVGFNGSNATVEVTAGSDVPVETTEAAPVETTEAAPVETTEAAPVVGDGATVYFSNGTFWDAVYIHYWNADGGTTWPGEAMNYAFTNEFGQDVYNYTVPAGTTGIIFNDGKEPATQTQDIVEGIVNNAGFYLDSNSTQNDLGHWGYGTWTYVPATTDTTVAEDTTVVEDTTVATGSGVTVGGTTYEVAVGDTITYTYTLTTPTAVENAQATTYYDAAKLELIVPESKAANKMFPVLRDITSVVYNTDSPGEVKFNAMEGVDEGFDFTEGGVLVTLDFKVLDASASTIYTTLEEMVKFGEKVDYATGGQIVGEGVSYVETLTGGTVADTSATETTVEDTTVIDTTVEDTTVIDTTVEDTTVEDTTVEDTTVEDTTVEDTTVEDTTVEDTTVADVTEDTTTAAPGTDPTSATEAGTTVAGTDAPATGAAAYIYVVVAVLAMAACAVVVLRKRVNG